MESSTSLNSDILIDETVKTHLEELKSRLTPSGNFHFQVRQIADQFETHLHVRDWDLDFVSKGLGIDISRSVVDAVQKIKFRLANAKDRKVSQKRRATHGLADQSGREPTKSTTTTDT